MVVVKTIQHLSRQVEEYHNITRFDRNLPMDTCRNTRQRRHRFSLASCSDQYQLVIRVISHLFQRDNHVIRYLDISQFHGSIHDIHHTAPLDHHLAVLLFR